MKMGIFYALKPEQVKTLRELWTPSLLLFFVVVTFLEWYHVGGLLSTRISPESDYDNLRGVPNDGKPSS
ncbi:hypothetical protein DPMN_005746 [Dreissena polymorpha]|uniref:Uncharacterized protein n=1 Tax=Dreissena polymorpha TaxID=45954 RepID=A0A9D4RUU0_DREPO|nr:hypothetical protein DPMN_005746 [Dreissena polymorpha]